MLHAQLDRRAVVVGAGALSLVAAPAVATSLDWDAELIRLGCLFDAAWSEQARRQNAGEDIEEPYEQAHALAKQIEPLPAITLAGLIVKARVCSWCHGGEPFDDEFFALKGRPTTDFRLAASVFRDLIAISGRPVPVIT